MPDRVEFLFAAAIACLIAAEWLVQLGLYAIAFDSQ